VGVGVGVGVGVSFRFLNFPGACFVKVMDALEKKCVYECVCVCACERGDRQFAGGILLGNAEKTAVTCSLAVCDALCFGCAPVQRNL